MGLEGGTGWPREKQSHVLPGRHPLPFTALPAGGAADGDDGPTQLFYYLDAYEVCIEFGVVERSCASQPTAAQDPAIKGCKRSTASLEQEGAWMVITSNVQYQCAPLLCTGPRQQGAGVPVRQGACTPGQLGVDQLGVQQNQWYGRKTRVADFFHRYSMRRTFGVLT
jgi:hypothetical protein